MSVKLETLPDGAVATTIDVGAAANLDSSPVTVVFSLHDDVAVDFWASFGCTREEAGVWRGQFSPEKSSVSRLVELVQLTADGTPLDLPVDRLFLEPEGAGEWLTGVAANMERGRLAEARARRFEVVLAAPNSPDDAPIYSAVLIADNIYLTTGQRVPGVRVIPLQNSTLGSDLGDVLAAVMGQLGFTQTLNRTAVVEMMQQRRPAAVIHVPQIRAAAPEQAIAETRTIVHRLLDLIALRRGDTPRLLVGVLGAVSDEGTEPLQGWVEGSGYVGNMLGGFISGEDIHGLLTQWEGIAKEPRVVLWLSLYADAVAEEHWDYRLFRCFNLLEAIGAEVLPKGSPVLAPDGSQRVQSNNQPYTTEHARGKVYMLLRHVAAQTQQDELNFTAGGAGRSGADLWDDVGIWTSIRNAVAHRGTWTLPPQEVPSRSRSDIERSIAQGGHDGSLEAGLFALMTALRSDVESTLYGAIRGLL